jgi:uncharacterized membrane protein AbrB (regulator of aidB expression)
MLFHPYTRHVVLVTPHGRYAVFVAGGIVTHCYQYVQIFFTTYLLQIYTGWGGKLVKQKEPHIFLPFVAGVFFHFALQFPLNNILERECRI